MAGRVETISVLYEIVSRIYGVIKASVWQRAVSLHHPVLIIFFWLLTLL